MSLVLYNIPQGTGGDTVGVSGSTNTIALALTPGANAIIGSGDNNNNMDNTSEESNAVTIYR